MSKLKNMKSSFWIIGFLIFCTACSHYDIGLENQLNQAAKNNNFFKVRTLLENANGKIAPEKYLYFSALSENKFDNCEFSNTQIESLLSKHKAKLNDSIIIEILETKASNFVRLYQYQKAVEAYSEILFQYELQLSSSEIENYKNMCSLFGAIAKVPSQRMTVTRDETIPAYRNPFNLLMVPIKSKEISSDFIFDSGANLSTISEGFAKKLNLEILDTSIEVGGATTLSVQSKLAVMDSIFVGEILFENVVFLVLPDEQLSFPEVNFFINGIVGFPVIHQMTEIQMHKNGTITVPKTPNDRKLNNLFLDFLIPIVALHTETDTLLLNLDTGARNTELSQKYYDKNKEEIEELGTKITQNVGSAGGIVEKAVYELSNFNFVIGTKQVNLPSVTVTPEKLSFTENKDGNLGQDVITQFDKMILNFKYMYIDFDMDN